MIGECSEDSFICGFRLAWELANELNHYMEARPELEEIVIDDLNTYKRVEELLQQLSATRGVVKAEVLAG